MPSGAFHTGRPNWFSNLSNGRRLSGRRQHPVDRRPPWAHSSMDCLMQQHPFQKLLDLSIGIRLGKQSHVFRCFTK